MENKGQYFFFQIENVLKKGDLPLLCMQEENKKIIHLQLPQLSSLHHQHHEQEKKGKCFPEIYITITITSQLLQSAQLSLVSDDFNNTLT